jgi:hypothetical protein
MAENEEMDGGTVDLKLRYEGGRERPLTLPVQFATRFVEFDGAKFERQKDGSYEQVGKAPHTILHGSRGGGAKSAVSNKKNGGK